MDGRQVALLAPTTVLAVQHLATLSERFAPFPVRVEMVSRFRTAAEIREVLEGVEAGNARDALTEFRKWQPAIVVLDINMPEMDGLAALNELGQAQHQHKGTR